MGVSTVLIGLLPTYAAIGIAAPIMLAVLRFGQGLGLGGEWGGAILLATENAPPEKRAWYGMFPQLGGPIGFFMSGSVFLALTTQLPEADFLDWGWRIPFVASALLVGDIEAPQEMSLLQRSVLQSVGVLLVPHHGSQTSSTESFIGALMPHWAVVQAAYRSRYGHPAPKVVERYESMGVKLVASPACGAAYWQSIDPEKLQCERVLRKRYWHYQRY
jgi:MFS family permease